MLKLLARLGLLPAEGMEKFGEMGDAKTDEADGRLDAIEVGKAYLWASDAVLL